MERTGFLAGYSLVESLDQILSNKSYINLRFGTNEENEGDYY